MATLGDHASRGDRIKLDKKPVSLAGSLPAACVVMAYYKPEGELVTRKDPQGRKTVYESLPVLKRGKWTAIGRLDINTTGLLLLTTDGELANRLMHPGTGVEREYAVRIRGQASAEQLDRLVHGVRLEDGIGRFSDIADGGGRGVNHWYHVVITEGRNREVRRLWESQGLVVSRLIRVRFGSYLLPRKKRPGQYWDLTEKEIDELKSVAGLVERSKT